MISPLWGLKSEDISLMTGNKYCYDYPRPAVSADCVVIDPFTEEVLLIERKNEPFKNMWAFPGGFVEDNETVESGVLRELKEETGLEGIPVKLVGVFSKPDRDPRARVITLAYLAHVDKKFVHPVAGDDARHVKWFPTDDHPPLAFDHKEILLSALELSRELI